MCIVRAFILPEIWLRSRVHFLPRRCSCHLSLDSKSICPWSRNVDHRTSCNEDLPGPRSGNRIGRQCTATRQPRRCWKNKTVKNYSRNFFCCFSFFFKGKWKSFIIKNDRLFSLFVRQAWEEMWERKLTKCCNHWALVHLVEKSSDVMYKGILNAGCTDPCVEQSL